MIYRSDGRSEETKRLPDITQKIIFLGMVFEKHKFVENQRILSLKESSQEFSEMCDLSGDGRSEETSRFPDITRKMFNEKFRDRGIIARKSERSLRC